MRQPPGFVDGVHHVAKLNRTLYGLKQAPRIWYETLSRALEELRFSPVLLEQPLRSVCDQYWQCQSVALQYITYPFLGICDHQSAFTDQNTTAESGQILVRFLVQILSVREQPHILDSCMSWTADMIPIL
jgi:hypothetical protein